MKTLIDIDDKLKTKFKLLCVKKNISMKQAIEQLIKEYLDENKNSKNARSSKPPILWSNR